VDGFSLDAYWARQWGEMAVTTYSDALWKLIDGFSEIQVGINQHLQATGLSATDLEILFMNDVNQTIPSASLRKAVSYLTVRLGSI